MKKENISTWYKQNRETIFALMVSALLAFIFLLNSPLHVWRRASSDVDSSVFKTIALMMDNGYMPYKDSFDHKGPLLYAINYWGLKISYYRGVWIFEFIFMTITFFMLYKIARLKTGLFSSIVVSLTAVSLLFSYFEGGNFTQEYAMPFIAIGIYIFLDYLLNTKITRYRIVISGLSMGAVCLLQPNMVAVWIVFCIAIFFRKIIEKEWKQLGLFVVCFLAGFVLIVTPFVVWLAVNGALQACIEDYIVFNMLYTSAEGGRASISAKWNSFFTFATTTVYIFALFGIAYNLKKKLFVDFAYAAYMIIGVALLCISGMAYDHYGMVLVPAVVYPLSLIMENVEDISDRDASKIIRMLITTYVMTTIIIPKSLETIKAIPSYYSTKDEDQSDYMVRHVYEKVEELTSEDDAISVYGNWDIIYVKTCRKHATKYSYQFPIGQVMPEIMDEYMEQLGEELPPIIVVEHYDDNILDFLAENEYMGVWPDTEEADNNDLYLVYYRAQKDS